MRKILTTVLAAVTLGAAALSTAVPASAEPRGDWHGGGHGDWHGGRGGYYHGGDGWRGDNWSGAAFAGIAGLALGAALASPGPGYYAPGPYYDRYYAPYPGYATCYGTRRFWDGYRWVYERSAYAC